jgi:hypothetical protein
LKDLSSKKLSRKREHVRKAYNAQLKENAYWVDSMMTKDELSELGYICREEDDSASSDGESPPKETVAF